MTATVTVSIERELASSLLGFADRILPPEDKPAPQRLADAIALVLGIAESATEPGSADGRLLALLTADQTCRSCGCSDLQACVRVHDSGVYVHASGARYDTCDWAEPGLCTACVPGAGSGWMHPQDQQEAFAA